MRVLGLRMLVMTECFVSTCCHNLASRNLVAKYFVMRSTK